jgi:hypothetical protein
MDIPKVYLNSGRKPRQVSSNSTVVTLNGHEINAEILEACRRGDREALRMLYEAYKDRVYSVSLYFFHGDEAAASDVTQQVFLKLITQVAKFRGDSDFSTWLYRNGRERGVARRGRRPRRVGRFDPGGSVEPSAEVPDACAAAVFRGSVVRRGGRGFELFHGDGGFAPEPGA